MSDCQPGGSGFNFRPGRGLNSQGSHSQILMTGDPTEAHIYPKRSQLQNLSPQKITTFLAYPQKSLNPFIATQKNPSVFFATRKYPGVFHRLKKNHFWPKFQNQKNHSDHPVIKMCEWGPGVELWATFFCHTIRTEGCRDVGLASRVDIQGT